jgi:hypothetical protein
MELKVSNQEHVALSDEREMQRQIIIGEDSLTLVHRVYLVEDQVLLGQRVVMIKSVAFTSLSVTVGNVVEQIERVHVIEDWRFHLVKDFLVQGIEVLAVVNDDLTVGCCH